MIEPVNEIRPEIVRRLVALDTEAFGHGGMNEWQLVPMIRHGRVYVIRKAGEIVGSIQYILDWDNPRSAYMFGVSIAKEWRGRGIGTNLLKESFHALSEEGIQEIELTVDPANTSAVTLYEGKLGFVITGSRQNEYGDGEDRLVMKRSLADWLTTEQ